MVRKLVVSGGGCGMRRGCMGFRVQGLGFGVWASGFKVQDLGFRDGFSWLIEGSCLGCRVQGFGCRVQEGS